jgi:hypothetical protein
MAKHRQRKRRGPEPPRQVWVRYEQFKQELARCGLSSREWEREIGRYCDRHGL